MARYKLNQVCFHYSNGFSQIPRNQSHKCDLYAQSWANLLWRPFKTQHMLSFAFLGLCIHITVAFCQTFCLWCNTYTHFDWLTLICGIYLDCIWQSLWLFTNSMQTPHNLYWIIDGWSASFQRPELQCTGSLLGAALPDPPSRSLYSLYVESLLPYSHMHRKGFNFCFILHVHFNISQWRVG